MDVAEFIHTYGKPYDPAADDYNVPPFQENVENASKSSRIYHAQRYWTKQDPYTVKRFIEHYTQPGDIVLDAFCGTGMTGVAAMMSGRHAILFDISPACIHMARNFTTPIEPSELERAYRKLRTAVDKEIAPLYQITCHKCGSKKARIISIVLSDIFKCPRCDTELLYASPARWARLRKGEKVPEIVCDSCGRAFRKNVKHFVRIEPIQIRITCPSCKVTGEASTRTLNEQDWQEYVELEGGKVFLDPVGKRVLGKMKKVRKVHEIPPAPIPYWYPSDVRFPVGKKTGEPLNRGLQHTYEMFSRRNLIALSTIWHYIQQSSDKAIQEKLAFIFTGGLFKASYMLGWGPRRIKGEVREGLAGPEGIRAGTLYIPSLISDKSVLFNFDQKLALVKGGMTDILSSMHGQMSSVFIEKRSAMDLAVVPNKSVDYLFYDPPYGSNIIYSELNLMWEAWLCDTTDNTEEIIENEYQRKGREMYGKMMTQALREGFRVLKPGRWLSLVYSYSDPSMYRLVQKMAHDAGFVDEGEVIHIGSSRKTKSQMDSDKTQQRYLVINFKKPKNGERKHLPGTENIEYNVIVAVQEFLQGRGGQTRDVIYDQVIKTLFTSVQIEQFNLDEILKNFFRKVGDKWYAPGALVSRAGAETSKGQLRLALDAVEDPETEAVVKLQEFLARHGTVPLAELREYFLREIPFEWQERVDFNVAIEGFVVKEGKVRLPSPDEQQVKQDVTARIRTREIRKFLEGTLDKQPADADLCAWIEFCYQHELFAEGVQLFSRVDAAFVDAEMYQKTKKIAEVCQLRNE